MFVDQLENIFMSQCEVNFKGLSIALVIGVPVKEDHMLQTDLQARPFVKAIHQDENCFAEKWTQMTEASWRHLK